MALSLETGGRIVELKDIQIKILSDTIASLISENAELRACIIVQNEAIKKQEVQDGEHQDSAANESDIS